MAFCDNADPQGVGNAEVLAFLQHLAVARQVAASTQNQALNALVFFYDNIVKQPVGNLDGIVRAKRLQRLPVVLTRDEVAALLQRLQARMVSWQHCCTARACGSWSAYGYG